MQAVWRVLSDRFWMLAKLRFGGRGVRETLLKKNGFRAFHVRYPHLYPHALLLRELGDAV